MLLQKSFGHPPFFLPRGPRQSPWLGAAPVWYIDFMEQPPPLTEAERTWAAVAHLALLALWNMVRGALAAGKGESYAYALILRLVP